MFSDRTFSDRAFSDRAFSDRAFSDRTNWKLTRNRLTEALVEVQASGARVLDLTLSNPTRAGLHYDEREILQALASPQVLDYDAQPKGLRSAREAVSDYYRSSHGIAEFDAERLILTTSTSEGYSFVFRLLCNPGDELLVPKPSYPLFEFLADLQDVKLVPYPLLYDHGWQMDFPSLEKAVGDRTRGVVVVHPNNPTGSYVHAHERELLNQFCREHGLAIIADEVFLDYGLDVSWQDTSAHNISLHDVSTKAPRDSPRKSFAANQDVLTFTLSGVSKISALPQMKVAWIATSGPAAEVEAAQARLEVIADTFLSMNAPIQWATAAFLAQRASIQGQLLKRVRANLAELDRQLAGQKICERMVVEAGWYVVLRVPVTQTDEELAVDLLREKSVLVHPGHFYDFPSDGYLVLSLIVAPEEFAEGIRRVLEFLIVDC
jgi:aspartate/methionine/tyrosine aminotransferase